MLRRMRACEAIFDGLVDAGLDDESEAFEDILWAAVECVMFEPTSYQKTYEPLAEHALRAKKHRVQVFCEWEYFVRGCGVKSLVELFENVVNLGRKAIADGISAEEGSGRGSDASDGAEPVGNADLSGDGSAGGGCAAAEAGADQEECLDYGDEDEETPTDRLLRAIDFGPGGPRRHELGLPREEPGEPSDTSGRVEGRKASCGGFTFTAERRAALCTQGIRL